MWLKNSSFTQQKQFVNLTSYFSFMTNGEVYRNLDKWTMYSKTVILLLASRYKTTNESEVTKAFIQCSNSLESMMLLWVLLNTTLSSGDNRMNYDQSDFIKKSKGFIIDMECLFLSPNMYSSGW